MLLPREVQGLPVDREVHIAHHRPLFHPCVLPAARTSHFAQHLFDHEIDVAAAALVVQDADVFQADKRPEDLSRVGEDEGAFCLLAHTSSLEHLRHPIR